MLSAPSEAQDEYRRKVLKWHDWGLKKKGDHLAVAQKARETVIYGSLIDRYLLTSTQRVEALASVTHVERRTQVRRIIAGMRLLFDAALHSEKMYDRNHPGILKSDAFHDAMEQLDHDLRAG